MQCISKADELLAGVYSGEVQGVRTNRPICGRVLWWWMHLHGAWPLCMAVAMVGLWLGFDPTTLLQTKCAHEAVCLRTSKPICLRKRLPCIHRANFIDSVLLGFSAILVTQCIAIPYWNENPCCCSKSKYIAEFICGTSEITVKITFPMPHHRLQYMYHQQWKAGQEPGNKTSHSVLAT